MIPMTTLMSVVKFLMKSVKFAALLPVHCRYQLWVILRPGNICPACKVCKCWSEDCQPDLVDQAESMV